MGTKTLQLRIAHLEKLHTDVWRKYNDSRDYAERLEVALNHALAELHHHFGCDESCERRHVEQLGG